uniref:Uncharacterized protein n=1 Tax=Setaria viridis TaxID=4556 RepID=A0A4U6T9N5_SETVI|nr:hypothetical protein SEVIR_9G574350v2 [Setaria viridis]
MESLSEAEIRVELRFHEGCAFWQVQTSDWR